MGWAAMPRQIGDPEDSELTEAVAIMLQKIINSGSFPETLSCTRLIVLNKTPQLTPDL